MIKDYFKELQTLAEYNEFIASSSYIRPNVSWVAENDSMHYGNELSSHSITVIGADSVIGESFTLSALYDNRRNVTTACTWTIVSGGQYATVGNNGTIYISSAASASNITVRADYQTLSDSKIVTITYKSGTETHTEVEVVTDESGNTTTTTTVVVENEDGSSQTESTTVLTDVSGNTIGSNETVENINPDGSSTSTSINYDENGTPTDALNTSGDSEGNVNVQTVDYDESGNSAVTSYVIDTSEGSESGKTYNGDGVNTEYYAFDVTHGFVLDFHFTINFSNQPAAQDEGHHNILTAKRASPEPWYGFQIRQSNANKYIQLGTQFSTGSNTNTTISATSIVNNTAEYSLKIVYNPTASTGNFVCYNLMNGSTVFTSNRIFPDIEELKYLKVTVGYALNSSGNPFRYSNINVIHFSLRKLSNVADPVISCDGEHITISCDTPGTSIYYRLNQGVYALYTAPISIDSDKTVEAYAELNGEKSAEVVKHCIYAPIIVADPIISCNDNIVVITCDTSGASILYRMNESGSFIPYENSILISASTTIEAYATYMGKTSSTVSEECIYVPIPVSIPTISCDGEYVTITCETYGANIFYSFDQLSYSAYTEPFAISADTVVYAYAELYGDTSAVVSEECIYDPQHDYSLDYLTFRVLSGGTIGWKAIGSGHEDVIEYSLNNGAWTSITASTTPTTISVQENDVVRFRGNNTTYAKDKSNYAGFEGGSASFNIEGNIMSLLYGDNFSGNTGLTNSTYQFCSIFKLTNTISAENLILPATTLKNYCYRAMFSNAYTLQKAPALPATTLATGCYWYMFENCAITTAPDLNATTLVRECYGNMFIGCGQLNYIKCLATSTGATSALTNWVKNVAATGTFVKDKNTNWSRGINGIPTGWTVIDEGTVSDPVIFCDGMEVEISCGTPGASIYYRLNQTGSYSLYSEIFSISADTLVQAYAELNGETSNTVSENCVYVGETAYEQSNKTLETWSNNNTRGLIETPYSVNAIDGHSSSYAKGTFNFQTSVYLRKVQPTYLWFQHADQSATIYVNDTQVQKHWGGYTAFFVDISNHIQRGTNTIKIALKNNEGNYLAPAAGDFNFNATLGNVKLYTSPVIPDMSYGYDGFHITSDVAASSATINVKTTIPTGATVVCTIDDGTHHFSQSGNSTGTEMIFTDTIQNPHLWNGTIDPHLYTVTLEIYHDNELYHRFVRPYGLRFYEYIINQQLSGNTYTGFLLNGAPYLLRGVCMHNDIEGKANALSSADTANDFAVIHELGCNFLRLAHYPHPKEVYDWCDQLGIIVQTEAPCVNKMQSTMPSDYYTHLTDQYTEMVQQHYNHPCILFWGLSNETTTDDKEFAKTKIEGYTSLIKALDPERWVGYVVSNSISNPSTYYNNPNVDWFGCNIYTGWYTEKASNNPTSQLNTRVTNIITNQHKPLAFSEYGAGGTQHCHSEHPQTTTTTGNYERHDIEYQMWLHEGHIAAIRNFPQLLFTSQWQLFDIAVSNRNEGYTVCLDGETTSIDDNLRRLNDKGLVERDHKTKKDTFYLYKAEWNTTPFIHICGKDYTRTQDRVIKCYTNDGNSLTLYVNNTEIETVSVTNNIATFTAMDFNPGDVIIVSGATANDTLTIHDYSEDYLTFTALEDGTFSFTRNDLQYSVDNGNTWSTLTTGSSTPTVTTGNKIMFKQTGLTPNSAYGIGTFSSTGRFNASGNIMSLYYGDNFVNQTDLNGKDYAFFNLFSNCTNLISTENLALPATTLASCCYYYMFKGCTSLTKAPSLPATTLVSNCYGGMFQGCSGLTTAPELPATTLASSCYSNMFNGCTSLTTAPALPITTLAYRCYYYMFNGCSGLTTAPALPATTLASSCYECMFRGCTSLTSAPVLPATTLESSCYNGMFYGCTNLTTAPELPATTLANGCYFAMFYACTNLNYIKCLATDISATDCTNGWVNGVSSTGTFVKNPNISNWSTGVSGIPTNWTVQDAS